MKKITPLFITIMVACMVLAGCTKDKVSFHARFQKYTPQTDSKVYMNDLTPCWNDGDLIKVNSGVATVSSDGSITEVDPDENGYGLFYPADWAGTLTRDGGTVTIPAMQTYAENADGSQNVLSPMAARAYESDNTITMYNVCGMLRLNVSNGTGRDMQVTRIVISAEGSASVYLSGTYQLAMTTEGATLTYQSGGSNTLTLDCSNVKPTVANGDSKYFYVSVPAFSDDAVRLRVQVYTSAGGYEYHFNRSQNNNGAHALLASQIGPVNVSVTSTQKTGAMTGVFSVSATKKVQFSCGNLRYNTSNSQWSFADSQTSFVGGDSQPNGNLIDLFGWATGNNPTNVSTNDADYQPVDLYDTEYDWCHNTIAGVLGHTWSLLTPAEWNYMMDSRPGTRYVLAKVNSVKGLVIFPDDYVHPSSVPALENENQPYPSGSNWTNTNSFSASNWQLMEAAGAVFLPQAGERNGNSVTIAAGRYWTGTNGSSTAVAYRFTVTDVSTQNRERHRGNSVRPVTVVQ